MGVNKLSFKRYAMGNADSIQKLKPQDSKKTRNMNFEGDGKNERTGGVFKEVQQGKIYYVCDITLSCFHEKTEKKKTYSIAIQQHYFHNSINFVKQVIITLI